MPAKHVSSGGLADYYHDIALDKGSLEPLREAAARYALAEAELREEKGEEVLTLAQEATDMFRDQDHKAGATDCVRLTIHAHILLGQREDAETLLQETLESARADEDRLAEAKMLLSTAELGSDRCRGGGGKEDQALQAGVQALTIFRELQEKRMEAATLISLAVIRLKRQEEQRLQDAEEFVGEALGLYRELGDRGGTAAALHWRAVVLAGRSQLQSALAAADEARKLFSECGDLIREAREYQVIATWCLEAGAIHLAVPAAEEAFVRFQELDCGTVRETAALQTLIRCYVAGRNAEQGLGLALDAATRHKEAGNEHGEADALLLVSQGWVSLAKELTSEEDPDNYQVPDEAIEAATRALDILRDLGDDAGEARTATLLSNLQLRRKEFDKASYSAQEAMWMFEEIQDPEAHGAALNALMSAHLAKQEYKEAVQTAFETREVFKNAGDVRKEAQALLTVSEIQFAQRKIDDAVAAAREAQSLFHQDGDRKGEGKALAYIAELRHSNGEAERALFAAERARGHLQRLKDKDGEARVLLIALQNRVLTLQRRREADARSMPGWEDIAKAKRDSKELINLCRQNDDKHMEGCALASTAQLLAYNDQFAAAVETGDQAISLFVVTGDTLNEASARVVCAKLYLLIGDMKKALEDAKEAYSLFSEKKDEEGVAEASEILDQLREFEFRVDGDDAVRYVSLEDMPGGGGGGGKKGKKQSAEDAQKKAEQQRVHIMATLQTVAAQMLGNEDNIEADVALFDIGINSMNAVLFRNKLMDKFEGTELPVTLIFDAPSLGAMSDVLAEQAR